MNPNPRQGTATLAVLIDADNAGPGIVEGLLAEVAKYGVAAVKRIYGDWTKPNLSGWKECLLSHSIQPIQQFRYTVGKNATDSAMIIDAMDLLYTGRFDGFCIVSSDSDFTRLASRIREQGLTVYGFGERKTPKPFVTACDKFIYSDLLRGDVGADEADEAAAPARRRSGGELRQDTRLVRLLQSAAQAVSDEEGWTTLGSMGTHIAKQAPEFDSRNYGYGKLSELVAATGLFEVETRNGGNNKTIWVRLKRRGEQRSGEQRGSEQRGGEQRGGEQRGGEQRAGEQRAGEQRGDRHDHAGQGGQGRGGQRGRGSAAPEPALEPALEPAPAEAAPAVGEPVSAPEPEQFDEPAVAAATEQAGHAAHGNPEPAAAPRSSRGRRASRRPDVKLSDTPWPIDSTVFAAPAAAGEALEVPGADAPAMAEPEEPVETAGSVQSSEAAPPARKRRSPAPRKRAAKKSAAAE